MTTIDNVGAWAADHKPVVIGGFAGVVLLALWMRHRANATGQTTAGQGGTAGATTDTGQYLVPYDSTGGSYSGGGGNYDPASYDNTALLAAITGLTTSINNLDPVTGTTNDGTDNAGGDPVHLHGTPIFAKPQPVHTAKRKTPVGTKKKTAKHPPHKTAAPAKKKKTAKREQWRPVAVPSRPVVRPLALSR